MLRRLVAPSALARHRLRIGLRVGRELLGELRDVLRRKGLPQDRIVDPGRLLGVERAALAPQRLHEEHVGPLLEQRDELVVDVLVAHHVGEAVDAGAHQVLDVVEGGDVRHHAHVVLVRLVDDRAIEVGLELLHGAVAVVDPDLDQVGLAGRRARARPGAPPPRW